MVEAETTVGVFYEVDMAVAMVAKMVVVAMVVVAVATLVVVIVMVVVMAVAGTAVVVVAVKNQVDEGVLDMPHVVPTCRTAPRGIRSRATACTLRTCIPAHSNRNFHTSQ